MGRKHCGKRRNCSLRAISPFPTVFSKDLCCRHVKTRACLGKGYNMIQFASGYVILMMVRVNLVRQVSVLTEKNIATVKTLIEEDARYTVQEIQEFSGIHSSSVLKILRERLGLRKICACWVPHLLTDKQKQSRVRLASQVIEKYDKCDPRHLEEIVTGDETWIYHFQPDSKAKNKVWVSSEGDRPIIARRCKTSYRMLHVVFFDSKGPVLQIPVPKGSSVTGKFYRESVLTQPVYFF